MDAAKATGLPLVEGITNTSDLPHTITFLISYRLQINNFYELPKDKRPPRNLWDKPYRLEKFFDEVFDRKAGEPVNKYIDIDLEESE